MRHRTPTLMGGMRFVLGTTALLALATPALALPHEEPHCAGKQTLVKIEKKVCPARPHRPPIVEERACCMHFDGKVHCQHFPHCPSNSPS